MKLSRTFTAGAVSLAALLAGGTAFADCGLQGAGNVAILSNDFEALRIVNGVAMSCATAEVTVSANATTEHKNIQGPALTANPAEYTVAVVANNSIVPLLNDDLIRPLDDLVAKYGASLQPNQLITIDGKVMAIAFMGNGQHLFYRKDILEKAGVAVPTSYEEMLAAAQAIKDAGLMEYPLAAADKPGWDLAAEFVNMYLGTGDEFFAPGSAELAIDNEPPAAPVGLVATEAGANDVQLDWSPNSEADLHGYLVYRGARLLQGDPGSNLLPLAIAAPAWLDQGVGDGSFQWRVQAIDSTGNLSAFSDPAALTRSGRPPRASRAGGRPTGGSCPPWRCRCPR